MALGAANGREVVIRLLPVVDDSAPKTFKKFGGDVEKVYKKIEKTAATTAERMRKEQDRDFEKRLKLYEKQLRQEEKLAKEKKKRLSQDEAMEEKFARVQERTAERVAQAKIRAADKAEKAFVTANKKMERANARVISGVEGSIQGILSFSKSLAMLGLVGEKDTKKIIDGLIKIQAGFGLLSDGIHVVMQLSNAWKAVRSAAAAAATAQAAAAAVGAAGGAKGAASAAGQVGANVAGGVIGGGIGGKIAGGAAWLMKGAVTVGGYGMAGARLATTPAGIIGMGALSYADLGRTAYQNWGTSHGSGFLNKFSAQNNAWYTPTGLGSRAGQFGANAAMWAFGAPGDAKSGRMTAAQQMARSWQGRQEITAGIQGQAANEALGRQYGYEDTLASNMNIRTAQGAAAFAGQRTAAARMQMASAQKGMTVAQGGTESGAAAAEEKYLMTLQRVMQMTQAERQAQRELNQERIQGAQQAIDKQKALIEVHRQASERWKNEGKGLGLRLADMDVFQRERAKESLAAVRSGKYTQEQYEQARGLGLQTKEWQRIEAERAKGMAKDVEFLTGGEYKKNEIKEGKAATEAAIQWDKELKRMDEVNRKAVEADAGLEAAIEKLAKTMEKINADRARVNIPKMIAAALQEYADREKAALNASGG